MSFKSFGFAIVITSTAFSVDHGSAAESELSFTGIVPVICEAQVDLTGDNTGAIKEFCNVAAPYKTVLHHDGFSRNADILIEYDGETVRLDPDGSTELRRHLRGGRFERAFRVSGAPADFINSFTAEAVTKAR